MTRYIVSPATVVSKANCIRQLCIPCVIEKVPVSIDDGETGESEDEESHLNVGACTVTGKTWLHTPFLSE